MYELTAEIGLHREVARQSNNYLLGNGMIRIFTGQLIAEQGDTTGQTRSTQNQNEKIIARVGHGLFPRLFSVLSKISTFGHRLRVESIQKSENPEILDASLSNLKSKSSPSHRRSHRFSVAVRVISLYTHLVPRHVSHKQPAIPACPPQGPTVSRTMDYISPVII